MSSEIRAFKRVPTGIKGLDEIMYGGLFRGGIYLIMGSPGAGKTILANQIGFNHVASGGRCLYISLLSEGHGRLFGHLQSLSFFSESAISVSFNFINAYQTLEMGGLDGLLKSLAQLVRQYKADLIFLDGVASAEELSKSTISFKKFVHDLNTVLATSGCTAVLLSSFTDNLSHPEHTMVDGIISLTVRDEGMESVRQIEVTKLRGSNHLRGRHLFTISESGISVFPRVETLWRHTDTVQTETYKKLSTGVPSLDHILQGGFHESTMTALLGAAGTGKTTLGCQFLCAGAEDQEPGLYFGFYESPGRLIKKMEGVNSHIAKHTQTGMVEILWQPPFEFSIDEVLDRLMKNIVRRGVKRLFIDGVTGLREGMLDNHRLSKVITALGNRLRCLGVTSFFTEETELFPHEIKTPISDHSAITDNIVFLRHVELHSKLVRFLTIMKTRESDASSAIHEYLISADGIAVGQQYKNLEAIMTGVPRATVSEKKKKKSGATGLRTQGTRRRSK